MNFWRAIIHGLVLALITVGAVLVGFAIYRVVGLRDQIAVQVLAAGIVCVGAFALWGFLAHRATSGKLSLASLRELGVAYAAAFVWLPIVFVPLHYTTQGYMTSFANILSTWMFQLPFNLLALMVANGRLLIDDN
jgi:hypothetical protein